MYNLLGHMHLHAGSKPFKCPYCSSKFNLKGNLSRHMKVKHGVMDISLDSQGRCRLWPVPGATHCRLGTVVFPAVATPGSTQLSALCFRSWAVPRRLQQAPFGKLKSCSLRAALSLLVLPVPRGDNTVSPAKRVPSMERYQAGAGISLINLVQIQINKLHLKKKKVKINSSSRSH